MREILFRAKHKNWCELPKDDWWVEGSYHHQTDYYGDPCDKHYIIDGTETDMEGYGERYEIDPETICQYTGMVDRNGKRIWEDDIVKCEHEKFAENDEEYDLLFPEEPYKYTRNYAVEFVNTGCNYGYRLRNKSIHFMLTGNVIYNHKVKVIGNIFDNPELLKGETEWPEQISINSSTAGRKGSSPGARKRNGGLREENEALDAKKN